MSGVKGGGGIGKYVGMCGVVHKPTLFNESEMPMGWTVRGAEMAVRLCMHMPKFGQWLVLVAACMFLTRGYPVILRVLVIVPPTPSL